MPKFLGQSMLGSDEKTKINPSMTDDEIIEAVARRVINMQLGVPAIFFLESTKPLSFLGSQLLIFLQPFVQTFLSIANYERFATMMENRDNVEKLIQRVEQMDEDIRIEEKRKKAEKKRLQKEEEERTGQKRKNLWQRIFRL